MEAVEPIRSLKKIQVLKNYLLGTGNLRNYALVVFGINSSLRIGDILKLTWADVKDHNGWKKHVYIREQKTGKAKQFLINRAAQEALQKLWESLDNPKLSEFIFKSREGANKAITRQQAYNIIVQACESVGVRERVGTHTLRKTWGYWAWKNGVPITLISEIYNHSDIKTTRRYLGITQIDKDDAYRINQL